MSLSGGNTATEQDGHWNMWVKRKSILKQPHNQVSMTNSWEERAFAEDAASPLGGCIWPPRSYSCSFCSREFRSAQALGGHMNVHRRDRARLKQCLSSHDQDNPCKSLGGSPHHNDFSNSVPCFVASSDHHLSPTPRVSENFTTDQHTFVSYSSLQPRSLSDSKTHEIANCTSAIHGRGIEESVTLLQGQNEYVETDLSLGLNFVVTGTGSGSEEEMISCKRRKSTTSVSTPLPFFLQLCLNEKDDHGLESKSTMEELDLELRLGDPSEVTRDRAVNGGNL